MIKDIEQQFLDEIDCNFPYRNKKKCIELIDRALSISSDAVYAVVYELAYPPNSKKSTPKSLLFELLDIIDNKFEHSLKSMTFELVRILINGQKIKVKEAIDKMVLLKKFPNEYMTLNMFYFSCDDVNEELEPIYEDVVNCWYPDRAKNK